MKAFFCLFMADGVAFVLRGGRIEYFPGISLETGAIDQFSHCNGSGGRCQGQLCDIYGIVGQPFRVIGQLLTGVTGGAGIAILLGDMRP